MCSRHLDMNLELMHQVPTGHLWTYTETQIFELRRFFVVVFLRLYSFISVREMTERAQVGGGVEGERKTVSPLSREPDTGLSPRTPRL